MKQGRIQHINWRKFRTSKFHFPANVPNAECGAYALHALTKHVYKKILPLGKIGGHWPDKVMFSYLRKHNYQVIPITYGNMVNSHSVESFLMKPLINECNVLLIDQKCYYGENSWSVVYGNMMGHSGEIEKLDSLELVNFPPEAIYLIWHEKWK
jgi:hypothetical protein